MKRTVAGAVPALAAVLVLAACGSDSDSSSPTTPSPTEESPTPQEASEPPAASEAPMGIDGDWCPTPESAETACVTVEVPSATFDDGLIVELFVAGEPGDGVIDYGMEGAPFGSFYPAGVAIDPLPDYYPGSDRPDEDRIWNSQTGTMLLRQ